VKKGSFVSRIATIATKNQEQLDRLQQLTETLSDDDLQRNVTGTEWSVVETLAHLAFYDRRAQVLLEKYAREGVSASPYDFQTLNDALLPIFALIPPRAVAGEVVAAAVAADQAAAAISDAMLAEIEAGSDVKPGRYEHRKNHLDDIEAVLGAG
jgi:hypothetical protein